MNEEFDIEEQTGFSLIREAYDWVESAISALVFVVLVFLFAGMVISVNGASMETTLYDSERLVCTKMYREPRYMDIVVVTNPELEHNPLIKRVIAGPGQTIDFDRENARVLVDGVPLEEPYINGEMIVHLWGNEDAYPMTVPEGHAYIMGDNRNNSWDSRIPEVGPVDQRYILGRVVYRIMPYDKMGVPG